MIFLVLAHKRSNSIWATFGVVEATLSALEFISKTFPKQERVTLLSGEDYPIRPVLHVYKFLQSNLRKIFMEYFKVPYDKWWQRGEIRFPHFQRINETLKVYGGSQWWSFPMDVVKYIVKFNKKNPVFVDYFKTVTVPDESFFQTLLLNVNENFLIENIQNTTLFYIKWTSPYQYLRTLTFQDRKRISKSKYLFARKFVLDPDSSILDFFDKWGLPCNTK